MYTLLNLINVIFQVYTLMLLARILGSWIPELGQSRFMQFIAFYVDPYLNLFRKIIPPLGMVDISPIFAFISLGIIEYAVKWLVVALLR